MKKIAFLSLFLCMLASCSKMGCNSSRTDVEKGYSYYSGSSKYTDKGKTVVVVYKPQANIDLPYDTKAVKTVMAFIADRLSQSGFRVFLPEELQSIRKRQAEMIADTETAIALARQEAGDVAVVVNLDAGEEKTSGGYRVIQATLTLMAYDTLSGELFASERDTDKTYAKEGEYGLMEGIARVAEKIGERSVARLSERICNRLSAQPSNFSLIFRNVSGYEQNTLERIVVDLGWRYRIVKHIDDYLEMEIMENISVTEGRRIIIRAIQSSSLSVDPVGFEGQRIVFEGGEPVGF